GNRGAEQVRGKVGALLQQRRREPVLGVGRSGGAHGHPQVQHQQRHGDGEQAVAQCRQVLQAPAREAVVGLAHPALSSAASSAFIQGPRSAGVLAEMRLPSTTVAWSTQSVPALTMSSRIAATLVARRPLRIFAEIGTQPAWQMNAIGLPASSEARPRPGTASERRRLSGAYPPGMTSASKSAAASWSTVVSTGTGP